MPDYSQAKLYKICSPSTEDIYIGSSCKTLSLRLSGHRSAYKRYKSGTGNYLSSFEILKYPDYYIELIRAAPCDTKQELRKLEGKEIRSTKCVNKVIPSRTKQQYNDETKENMREYYQNNKEHKKKCVRQNYIKNRVRMLQYTKRSYERKKDLRNCPCGGVYNYGMAATRNRHFRTNIHQEYLSDFYNRLSAHLTQ